MAILTLTCPKCEKTALIDDEDDESFCLHCGNRFTPEERAGADASGLYDLISPSTTPMRTWSASARSPGTTT